FKAVTYGFLLLLVFFFIGRDQGFAPALNLPRSVIALDYVLVFVLIAGLRVSKRLYVELFAKPSVKTGRQRLLIIGAGDAAEQLLRSIKQNNNYPFNLAGILDDSDIKQGTSIHNIKILGRINDLLKIKNSQNIYGIIIAIPSASSLEIKRIVDLAQNCGINYIKILPSLTDVMSERVSLNDVRDIDVEDLLGRQKIDISFKQIRELIKEKTVLITGAAGSIGFELVKQISKLSPKKIIALDMDETGIFNVNNFLANLTNKIDYKAIVANILQKDKIDSIFAEYKPDIIFHAAAYKHVKLMEQYPDQAVLTNILGTWNMAQSASLHNVEKFVLISTDKAVNPRSVMGMTKRAAEILIMHYNGKTEKLGTKYIAVRFGNVLGSRGSVVPLFKQQIMTGGPVTITHPEMKRYFMIPSEAILLVLQAAALGDGGEIFVLDMGQPVKILELAKTMIRLAGLEPDRDIPIIFTKPESGEKLFEEILTDRENMDATRHQKIFVAKNNAVADKKIFFENIERLIELAKKEKIAEELKTELTKMTAN
ncbi:MAG: nucleoside-diphosphate sugar epimerase/dehydratase, partial [Patescibacteria group bacterium]